MTSLLLRPGQPVGPYLIETYLTTGTFGDLYRARHISTQELVALKVLNVPFGVRVGLDIYALGARLLTLEHPCLVPVRELHLDEIPQYVVMAYAAGGSLSNRLDSAARALIPAEEALALLSRAGSALTYLHGQNLVHRGVQPASILFDALGQALLSGLDLALAADQLRSPPCTTPRKKNGGWRALRATSTPLAALPITCSPAGDRRGECAGTWRSGWKSMPSLRSADEPS
jgi:serine/threonine protein kinase